MKRPFSLSLTFFVGCFLACALPCHAATYPVRQIALRGEPVPGALDGAVYGSFEEAFGRIPSGWSPTINSAGEVAFLAPLRLPNGEWAGSAIIGPMGDSGPASGVIVRTGDPVPRAVDDLVFSFLSRPFLTTAGSVVFESSFSTVSGDEVGFGIIGPAGGEPLSVLARNGQPAPGAGLSETLAAINAQSLVANSSGDIAFRGVVEDPDGGTRSVLFGPTLGAGSPLGRIAQTGKAAPGTRDGDEYSNFGAILRLNDAGQLLFTAGLNENRTGLFGPVDGGLGLIARTRDPAPGDPSGATIFDFDIRWLNDRGDVAFYAQSSNQTLYGPTAGSGSAIGPIARSRDPAPDGMPGDSLRFFGIPAEGASTFNNAGDVAFTALVINDNGSSADQAIFGPVSGAGSPLGILVRTGDPIPGHEELIYGIFPSDNKRVALNDSGDLVFPAILTETDGTSARTGLLAYVEGELTTLAVPGDEWVTMASGSTTPEVKVIDRIGFNAGISRSRGVDVFNNAGEVVFALAFTDGTQGIFTVDVTPIPEGSSAALLLGVAALHLGRSARAGRSLRVS